MPLVANLATALIGGLVIMACSTHGSQTPVRYGYIVPGPKAVAELRISNADTIPELPEARMPERVITATARVAIALNYQPSCSRYFRANDIVVVLLKSGCGGGETIDDGEGLAAFTIDGEAVGRPITSLTPMHYSALQPTDRPPSQR
jgi:hypothetical protein